MGASRALVLGGGGVAGIAWETGLLFGLAEHDVDVLAADLIVGTSAGAAVAAQMTAGVPLGTLYDRQLRPAEESTEMEVDFDVDRMIAEWGALLDAHEPGAQLRAAIGGFALAAATPTERRRREVIAARLPSHDWPEKPVGIVAVDAGTGEVRVFVAADGVPLVDAVAASCAVPGVWPPVTIGDRRYIDGGVRSPINLDVAGGHDVVLVLAPSGDLEPTDPEVTTAAAEVEKNSSVLTVRPDQASLAAFGPNPLDPTTAGPSARAGRAQADDVLAEVRALWSP